MEGQKNIVVEVGGTNMRAIMYRVKDGQLDSTGIYHDFPIKGKLTDKARNEKTVFKNSDDFFNHLFKALPNLKKIIKENPDALLSIIFSFPGQPTEIECNLDYEVGRFTKEFDIPGMEYNNFIPLLKQYLEKHKITAPGKIALFNDTAILPRKGDNVGLVVATGYNYALLMSVKQLREILGPQFAQGWDEDERMIVNVEAGNLNLAQKYAGDNNPNSIFSRVDARSSKPGEALDEKLISGKYLGEALKCVLEDLNKITNGQAVKNLKPETKIKAEHISSILEDDWATELSPAMKKAFKEGRYQGNYEKNEWFLPFKVDRRYRSIVKEACRLIKVRSAQIAASMVVGGLDLAQANGLSANIEGPVFWNMPGYKEEFAYGVRSLKGDTYPIRYENAKNPESYRLGITEFGSLYYGGLAGLGYLQDAEKRASI